MKKDEIFDTFSENIERQSMHFFNFCLDLFKNLFIGFFIYLFKGMCREHDWLMQYNYIFCLIQSMESHETMEFHSKRFCFISKILM